MCGRYASLLPAAAIARLFATGNPLPNLEPSWNVCPQQQAPVVRWHKASATRHLDLLRWGLLPHFVTDPKAAPRPINARAETVATSGMFRGAFAQRRCLVPADAFYEWRAEAGGKQPYAIARRDRAPFAFAGLWESWRAPDATIERSFTIITTAANATLSPLHARMPVIIAPPDWPLWLGEQPGDAAGLLRPAAEELLEFWPVSRAVNAPRNNGAALLEPLAPP